VNRGRGKNHRRRVTVSLSGDKFNLGGHEQGGGERKNIRLRKGEKRKRNTFRELERKERVLLFC